MKNNPLKKLDPGQKKAVMSQTKNTLCLAGAGSGKTRVLTTRIFYLIKNKNIKEDNILSITFTRNAAQEMLERLDGLGINTKDLWCRTFHGACFKILKEEGLGNRIKIIDEKKQDDLLAKIIKLLSQQKDFGYRLYHFCQDLNWPDHLFFEEVQKILKECKNRSINLKSIIKRCSKEKDQDVLEFYRLLYVIKYHYQKYLSDRYLYDFSDLILKVIQLLSKNNEIIKKYQQKFKYILVDEFQDVDFAQMKLLKLLNGLANNLFVVGDDWQSIYGFRGGDVSYILGFVKHFSGASETIALPYNYRSDKNIVRSASGFIRHNKKQQRKKIKSFNPGKIKLKVYRSSGEEDAQKFVVRNIWKIIKYGVSPSEIMLIGRNWKNIKSYREKIEKSNLPSIQYNSIHGAKGMEADVVFIVGLHRGRSGFPTLKDDYDIVKLIKDATKRDRLEEERRCMYVAITRARKLLFLITEKEKESIFIKELSRRYYREL